MINNFLELHDKNISDIIKVGFIDTEDGYARMNFANKYLFIEFDSFLLKFTSIEQYSQLQVEIVSDITFDIELDDDLIPAQASVSTIVLTDDMGDNKINSIELYNCSNKTDQNIQCDAMSIYLACGQEIFIDPTYYFGLNIGGKEQKEKWLLNLPTGTENITSEVISLVY